MANKSHTPSGRSGAAIKVELEVCLGKAGVPVGKLVYVKDGSREFSQFAYREDWLASPAAFDVSPDLLRTLGYQVRKPSTMDDPCFFLALGDTQPDSWGRRVIARAHARERKDNPSLRALAEIDYLCAVDDASRVGALRLRNAEQGFLRSAATGKRTTPPMLELEKLLAASRAVELSQETVEDLRYLQGRGTSLGGMRPKCSVLDEHGALALGKFPSVSDERSVTRGEVLALRLAKLAGIDAAEARIVCIHDSPVAIIRRFDRTREHGRIPYMSAGTLLQANRNDEHAYTEVVDAMRARSFDFGADARQLWRRLAFNHLITNVDDHLQNTGFLYVDRNQWRLAPAFDLNPFPDRDRESKTWLSEDTGPITSISQLVERAALFHLTPHDARAVLGEVVAAVEQWRSVAQSADVGLTASELDQFEPAFEHADLREARALCA